MLVQEICNFQGFEHVAGIAVAAEADADAALHHVEDGGAADGVAHVGFRIVHDAGAGVAEDADLSIVNVDAVGGDGAAAEEAEVVEAVDDALAVFALAMSYVRGGFRGVDVEAGVETGGHLRGAGEGAVTEGEGGVQAEESAEQAIAGLAAELEEGTILTQALVGDGFAIAVRDFVTEAAADAGLLGRVCNAEEAAGDGVGAGVMIEDGGDAVADAIDHADHGAGVGVIEGEDFIEAPPEAFENLQEGFGRVSFEGHASGEGAVEMEMGVDEAGHDEAATGIDRLGHGVALAQRGGGADRDNEAIVDGDATVFKQRRGVVTGNQATISD